MNSPALGLAGFPCNAEPARPSASSEPTRSSTQRGFLNHAPLRRRSFMPLPTRSVSLRFQEPSFSASRSLPSFHRSASAPNCSMSSAILKVQSNGIFCGFLKSKSVIVLVRHHPLPQSRNARLAVAVIRQRNKRRQRICRHLLPLVAPNLSDFGAIARWILSPCMGVLQTRSKRRPLGLKAHFRLIPPPLRLSHPPLITTLAHL